MPKYVSPKVTLPRTQSPHQNQKFVNSVWHGSNACWIHTITIKYKYKLDNKNIKNIVKGTPGLTHPKRHLGWFSHFYRADQCVQHVDRHTHTHTHTRL